MRIITFTTFKVFGILLLAICLVLLFLATINFIQMQFASVGWHGLASIGWNGRA